MSDTRSIGTQPGECIWLFWSSYSSLRGHIWINMYTCHSKGSVININKEYSAVNSKDRNTARIVFAFTSAHLCKWPILTAGILTAIIAENCSWGRDAVAAAADTPPEGADAWIQTHNTLKILLQNDTHRTPQPLLPLLFSKIMWNIWCLTQPGFELMTSESWQYISCHWDAALTTRPSVNVLLTRAQYKYFWPLIIQEARLYLQWNFLKVSTPDISVMIYNDLHVW